MAFKGSGSLDLEQIHEEQVKFAREREWEQFHTPKNLAMALSVEAAELCEILQWKTEKEQTRLKEDSGLISKISDELADVLFYTLRMANVLEIDIESSYRNKMKKNAEKYPIEKVRGKAVKYTDL